MSEYKQSEETYSRFFSLSLDLFCIASFDGYFQHLNPAWTKILGWSTQELLEKPFIEFVHPEDREFTILTAQKLENGVDAISFENRYLCQDGSYKWLSWNAISAIEKNLFYALAHDITVNKQKELELKDYIQELEAFKFALNAHSLVAITDKKGAITYANDLFCEVSQYSREELLGQDHDLDFLVHDLTKILSSMKMGTNRIREIVISLRNFSRLDEAEKKLVDIHEGIENTLLILHHRWKDNSTGLGISLIKEYGDLPLVDCYPGQLNQVFMNIITNALDALEESVLNRKITGKPQIRIRTEVLDKNFISIRIADNGSGTTEEVRARLFDPFFTTKPVGKGTGLGLSISYQIVVEKHGGTLKCLSELGKGTEFWIQIPVETFRRNVFTDK
ncbi:PAS domain S-box protein [Nostoc sp. UHCC 0702]|nr:PAS domain S-box protein [Nostoc sp. UHCC 0702]